MEDLTACGDMRFNVTILYHILCFLFMYTKYHITVLDAIINITQELTEESSYLVKPMY